MAEDIARHLGPLSESTDGKLIKVTATASAGTLVHTTTSGKFEKLWVMASNEHTSAVTVTIEWGGTTADDRFAFSLDPTDGPQELASGWVLGGTGTLDVRVYASVTNVVYVLGEAILVSNTI